MAAEYFASHMGYPNVWELGSGPNPELMANYLEWLVNDDQRFGSAVRSMQWYPPGFHGLLIAIDKRKEDATHRATLQLNFYHEDYPGDEEPHAHSRDAFSSWYAPEGTNQVLTRYHVIPDEAPRFRGLPVEERAVMAMNIGDQGDGQRPLYMPSYLGTGLILSRSVTNVATLGSQEFDSTEVHHAGFRGKGVAISVHFKGPEEVAGLNTLEGYIYYKNLSQEAAEKLLAERTALSERLQSGSSRNVRLAPSTTLYPKSDRVADILVRDKIAPPSPETSEKLIIGALVTAKSLAKS